MTNAFVQSVGKVLSQTEGYESLKQQILQAAEDLAQGDSTFHQLVRNLFWAWLSSGKWKHTMPYNPVSELPRHSVLDPDYITRRYPNESPKALIDRLARAREERIKRTVGEILAGCTYEEACNFVMTYEELCEAISKAKEQRLMEKENLLERERMEDDAAR